MIRAAEDNEMRRNRVLSWRKDAIEIAVASPELDDLLAIMQNKQERNDKAGYEYNARRYVHLAGLLADEALHDLAQLERRKYSRLISAFYLLGAIAVICAPMTTSGLIVPVALTLLAIQGLNLRMKRRAADIMSFSYSADPDLKFSLKFPDQSAGPVVKMPAQKGGPDV